MALANTVAYYDTEAITAVKSFLVQAPGMTILDTAVVTQEEELGFKLLGNFRFFFLFPLQHILDI